MIMGGSSAASSCSSSSPSSLDSRSRSRRHSNRRHGRRRRDSKRRRKRNRDEEEDDTNNTRAMPAAPSDWDELRAHYQFVLPTDNDDNHDYSTQNDKKSKKYGATWQERMVQHYHQHLYKEYVLADLSRVHDLGKVGLRWRTENEVANGRGFRCCGNLKCEGGRTTSSSGPANAGGESSEKEAYAAAARRHMGIAVAENGGKEPMGVVLPNIDKEKMDALEMYLQSCAEERWIMQQDQAGDRHDKHESKKKSSKHEKKRHRRDHKHSRRDKHQNSNSQSAEYSSLQEQEKREQQRLSSLPFGMGLHDYEVDFVYVERGMKKRELVKVRLCLRCAPLLFVAKMKEAGKEKGNMLAPAVKAREARENAARSHHQATMAGADDVDTNYT